MLLVIIIEHGLGQAPTPIESMYSYMLYMYLFIEICVDIVHHVVLQYQFLRKDIVGP